MFLPTNLHAYDFNGYVIFLIFCHVPAAKLRIPCIFRGFAIAYFSLFFTHFFPSFVHLFTNHYIVIKVA